MTTVSVTTLVDALRRYRLLEPVQLEEVAGSLQAVFADAKALAGELIRRGWLTPFQANLLLQGRGDSLVYGTTYVLLERLARGGMGQVFKARHALMNRLVAIKVIRADRLDQPEVLGRFHREMQAAAKLTHPNVVLALDAALVGDVYLLVMEYVEGADLAQLLKQGGRLLPAQASGYVRQAAQGLQHIHERGLVHRDIKPSNLILAAADGVVKILDLGLARLRTHLEKEGGDSLLTRDGAVMGTPDYIAPEQARDSHLVDIRADVYSLGCTLYHLLTGQPPFPGGSLTEKLLKHQQAEPERMERLRPDVPAGLADVVRKMMAKRPEDRYPVPREVVDALAPFTSRGPATAASEGQAAAGPQFATTGWTPTPSYGVVARGRTGPAWPFQSRAARWTGAGLAACLGVLIVVLVFLLRSPAKQHPSREDGIDPSEKVGLTPRDLPGKEPGVDLEGGGAVEPATLAPLPAAGGVRLVKKLTGHTGTILDLSFAPNGKRLASAGDDHQVRLWNSRTWEQQGAPLRHGAPVRALAWSSDGTRLASGSWDGGYDASVKVWNLQGAGPPRVLAWKDQTGTPSRADVRGLAFSPDCKRLASGGGPLRLWNLSKGGDPVVLNWQKTFPSYLYGVAFAPDGKIVAGGCHEMGDSVRLWEVDAPGDPILARGNEQAFGISHTDVRGVVAFARGGKLLVRVTSDGQGFMKKTGSVKVWEIDSRREFRLRDTYRIPGGAVFALASAADGHLRVAVAVGKPGFGQVAEPSSDEVKLWDGVTQQVQSFAAGHKESITALAFSPDGARLATGSSDQLVKIWDLTP